MIVKSIGGAGAEIFDLKADMGLSGINENRYQYSANLRAKQVGRQ